MGLHRNKLGSVTDVVWLDPDVPGPGTLLVTDGGTGYLVLQAGSIRSSGRARRGRSYARLDVLRVDPQDDSFRLTPWVDVTWHESGLVPIPEGRVAHA